MAASVIPEQKKNTSELISPDGMPSGSGEAQPKVAPEQSVVEENTPTENEEAPVDVMDFLKASGREPDNKKPEAKTEAKVETKPDEVKPETKTQEVEVKFTAHKPVVNARDYTDIDPEHKPAFERMSNEAFNLLKPRYIEHKQLKAKETELSAEIQKRDEKIKQITEGKPQIPENYYEHENAFVLTPEFAEASQNINAYNTVLNHWQTELDAIRAGTKETYQEIHQNPQTGQFYLSAPLAVDKTTEGKLHGYTSFAQQKLMEAQAEVNILAKSHKTRHGEAINWVKSFETGAFKNFETNETLKAQAKDAMQMLHPSFRNNPLASAFAKALVTIDALGKLLQAKASAAPQVTPKVTPKANGNLNAAEIAGDGGKGKTGQDDVSISMDDFNRVKEGV